ncbi:MAG: MurR/RpiR family transcriptional regulator [Eubacteriaceae bacterium]
MIKNYNDLIENIKFKFDKFSPSQKKIAEYIIENIDKVGFFTINELASHINVSETTVVRFAYKMGFESYSVMHKVMQNIFKEHLSPVKKINQKIESNNLHIDKIVESSIDLDINHLNELKKNISVEDIENTIRLLQNANSIYVTGYRTSYGVAHLCNLVTNQILSKSILIKTEDECIPEIILSLRNGDLLIAISLPRYTERLLHIVKYAKSKKVQVIAITDSYISPVGRLADIVIPCGFKGLTYQNTLVPANAVINLIINILILFSNKQQRKTIKERFIRIEEQLSEWKLIYLNE